MDSKNDFEPWVGGGFDEMSGGGREGGRERERRNNLMASRQATKARGQVKGGTISRDGSDAVSTCGEGVCRSFQAS